MRKWIGCLAALLLSASVHATIVIPMYSLDTGKKIGYVNADNTVYGLILSPHLKNLPPGIHGLHIHEFASCACHGEAAGGHYDPELNRVHLGPFKGEGHLGDLPVLIVSARGYATQQSLAPRVRLADLGGHTLVIDAYGDNYDDVPRTDGGGGPKIACGVIPYY